MREPGNLGPAVAAPHDVAPTTLGELRRRFAAAALVLTLVLALAGVGARPAGAAAPGPGTPAGGPTAETGVDEPRLVALEVVDGRLEVTTHAVRDAADAREVAETLGRERDLVALDVDAPVSVVADPLRQHQWNLDRLGFEAVWPFSRGAGIRVAVLDTGVRGDHEDLAGTVLPGADFVGSTDGRVDPHGHGTHVAGIVTARPGNGAGIHGAAPGARILPVRVLGASGTGKASDVAAGIIWAADNGAQVVNLSLATSSNVSVLHSAVQYAAGKGVTLVGATGNSAGAGNPVLYPAAYGEVIAVGAVTQSLARASFSGHGPHVELVAPGVGIMSTYANSTRSYASSTGTSMAAPHVAAAAALLRAREPGLSAAQVRHRLAATATDLGPTGRDHQFGHGLVNPVAAVAAGLPKPSPSPSSSSSSSRGGSRFPDVPSQAYFRPAVDWAVAERITDGFGNTGRFAPHETLSRAQIAAFLHRAAGNPRVKGSSSFPDVPGRSYYAKPVRWLMVEGITDGLGDTGRFLPHHSVTRGQLATFLWRAAGSPRVDSAHGFGDVPRGAFFERAVRWMRAEGLTTGVDGTARFEPHRPVTRAETVTFLHRLAKSS